MPKRPSRKRAFNPRITPPDTEPPARLSRTRRERQALGVRLCSAMGEPRGSPQRLIQMQFKHIGDVVQAFFRYGYIEAVGVIQPFHRVVGAQQRDFLDR